MSILTAANTLEDFHADLSDFSVNKFNTTLLVRNVMENVARKLELDIHRNDVAASLYEICCDLEDFPKDEGFGSSDHYSYVKRAREELTYEIKARIADLRKLIRRTEWRSEAYRSKVEIIDLKAQLKKLKEGA
jgi:hypothetical protein